MIDVTIGTSDCDVGGVIDATDRTGGTDFDGTTATVEAGSEMWHPIAASCDSKA